MKHLSLTSGVLLIAAAACSPAPTEFKKGSDNFEGQWNITASCPAKSPLGKREITATAIAMETSADQYSGVLNNSMGGSANFVAVKSEDTILFTVNWSATRNVSTAILKLDPRNGSFKGTDSYLCDVVIRR